MNIKRLLVIIFSVALALTVLCLGALADEGDTALPEEGELVDIEDNPGEELINNLINNGVPTANVPETTIAPAAASGADELVDIAGDDAALSGIPDTETPAADDDALVDISEEQTPGAGGSLSADLGGIVFIGIAAVIILALFVVGILSKKKHGAN